MSYVVSWFRGADRWAVEGRIGFSNEGPAEYVARVLRNTSLLTSESTLVSRDSLITIRSARVASRLRHGAIPVPGLIYSPVRMVLLQCALRRPNRQLETGQYGRVQAEEVAATTIHSGPRSKHVRLFLLWTEVGGIAARGWVDDQQQMVAYPGGEGEVDIIRPEWKAARNQLLDAEVRASSPNCHFGDGPGGCENTPRICNLPTSMIGTAVPVRRIIISDSGYLVWSDGNGPYIRDSVNAVVNNIGLVAGLILEGTPRSVAGRSYLVDLNHPVRGDIGKPLGVVRVDGRFPARFYPSGTIPRNELLAHANTDWDEKQHSLGEVPLGGSISLDQIGLDLYIDGVLHVLQMGPQPYGALSVRWDRSIWRRYHDWNLLPSRSRPLGGRSSAGKCWQTVRESIR